MKVTCILNALRKEITQNLKLDNSNEIDITGICYDSRKAAENNLFICISGTKSDGHEYIPEVYTKGVRFFLVESRNAQEKYASLYPDATFIFVNNARRALALSSAAFFGNPADTLKIIGLTGTKGKTSTSFMITRILQSAGYSVGLIGTTGVYYKDQYEEINNSTPESYELQRFFHLMKDSGVTHVVMEVSSQALMMDRTYGIPFETAVFTNISPDHIGPNEHNNFEDYLHCKGLLFKQCRNAVVNVDDEHSAYIINILKENGVSYHTYSFSKKSADYYSSDPEYTIDHGLKTSFVLNDTERIHVNVPGKFSVFNALAAAAVTMSMGVSLDHVKDALSIVHVIGRVEPVKHEKCKVAVLIDYAHNALSMESLFEAINAYAPKRTICLFGCGGNRSKLRRYDMGEISGNHATISVVTSDNPRFEEPLAIIDDILIGMKKTKGEYVVIPDRREAIAYALSIAAPGDIVLLAGKGQEDYQEIKGEKFHMDEREIVKEYYDKL
jgi:UDP-N-acetylmuramyl-tripeptide synthetase